MIPITLEIKNFLSYGEPIQTIDFAPYHLICLSGKNGNGKSALLDAITWALWGQARKVSAATKADDGLVRLGQTRMMVSLTFLFNHRTYRVRREYAKTYGKPFAALDFEVYEEASERFFSLTDKTIRATQSKIQSLIGLDFDTFINSAFIRQGQSNEFSKKSAKERKQILGTPLGLNKYDGLQQSALEKVRGLEQEKKMLLFSSQQAMQTISQEERIKTELATNHAQLLALNNSIIEQQATAVAVQEQKVTLTARLTTLAAAKQTFATTANTIEDRQQSLRLVVQEWRNTHRQTLQVQPRTELEKQRQLLAIQEEMLIKKHEQQVLLQQQLLLSKNELLLKQQQIRHENEQQLQAQKVAIQQLALEKKRTESIRQEKEKLFSRRTTLTNNLKTGLAKIAQLLTDHAAFEREYLKIKHQFEKRRTYYQTLVQRGNWTRQNIADLERRQAVVHDTTSPSCPLCQQLLTAKRKQFLASNFDQEAYFFTHRLQRISATLKKLKELLVEQNEQLKIMTARYEQGLRNQAQHAESVKQLALEQHELDVLEIELTKIMQEESTLGEKLKHAEQMLTVIEQSMQQDLEHSSAIKEATASIITLEAQLKELDWQHETYQQLKEQRNALEALLLHQQQQETMLEQQRERRNRITRLIEQLKNDKKALQALVKTLAPEEDLKKELLASDEKLTSLSTILQHSHQEKEELLQVIGKLEHELAIIASLLKTVAQTKIELDALDKQIHHFQQLSVAFSKNGIQALLIEEAVPEIEQEANHLLARLTDNQAQIFIESLKDLKSGGVKETLDIHIADTAGIRPYELFSGGEAFRVDFALRIAIAKLLARRAGTALQTLIIDEGFGSQDEDGLANIMDALYAIQQDFAKIIIVSHLPEFKHNFPVHFIVEKNATGSAVRIEERG